ncbi:MAG: 50S ribosomal protein L29 [Candidatus Yonathbacteria bacterium CG_4_10_14_3_um_filter_47_65]|uniref:Large ribosomal subunit protein uL29 n=2 Tax=Parcubacteria group TaxID=1794811 RepID=A0A2M8D9U3_9BACT|nr:MAG: 50S ribosomal protein L29 [Candidatus Nomurabacteria bacterium CG1_02_47_685]PIP03209.1 MAG: 50S ribosomal protein L29 [Candidatus Yonathbacteria bacterium CG23_combo_of_CG06-09_8_20_14_all_46_18]PIQ31905.1 MAG: 50S ribosomal protein L29 [Candidatus Yonathbacteria bacterium CG17_big_fil_post_rev_8_21_14_2_50_46_19]PIX56327.1 MAG: 50S ribosomal protein L29 [Candidatus Yonathbacteria bacterium CG_4_10_14_3_um_filter_47_65]PIY57475.1 MAG: 50S ribosomal protein L29 [Candidatus Yonathbacteri
MSAENIKDKKDSDLEKAFIEKKKKLREFRFGIAGSKIKNVKEARNVRKDVARILTEARHRA